MQDALIGINRGGGISAIHPFVNFSGAKFIAIFSHTTQGIRELVFATFYNIIIHQIFNLFSQIFAFFEIINSNHSEVADECLWLFYKICNRTVSIKFNYTEGRRIVNLFYPEHAILGLIKFKISAKRSEER